MVIKTIAGPLIGAFIGYITNYIAVKMLFRPYKEIKIFGKRLPFTPGIIPKRKSAVAKAVGDAVCKNLLTKSDIENEFFSDSAKQSLKEKLLKFVYENRDLTSFKAISSLAGEESAEKGFKAASKKISEKLSAFVCEIDIKGLVEEKGAYAVKDALKGSFIEMFANEELIKKLLIPFGAKAEEYLKENAFALIHPRIEEEAEKLKDKTVEDIIAENGAGYDEISYLADICINVLQKSVSSALKSVDFSGIIEKKINKMNEKEIEALVLSVMKNELSAIVNLGALIGFILGLVNLIF